MGDKSYMSNSSSGSSGTFTNVQLSTDDLTTDQPTLQTHRGEANFLPNSNIAGIYSPTATSSSVSIYKGRNQEPIRRNNPTQVSSASIVVPPVASGNRHISALARPSPVQVLSTSSNPASSQTSASVSRQTANIDSDEEPEDIVPDIRDYYSQYYKEIDRLATFNDWPRNAPVSKEELAKNGFIYQHIGDRVQCVFCRACLSNWEPGDNVANEHRKHCPDCHFAFGYSSPNIPLIKNKPPNQISRQADDTYRKVYNTTVNVPVRDQNRPDAHGSPLPQGVFASGGSRPHPVDQSQAPSIIPNHPNLLGVAGVITEPKYTQWSDEKTRLESYRGWPAQMSQTPRELAAAGLLYMGKHLVHVGNILI